MKFNVEKCKVRHIEKKNTETVYFIEDHKPEQVNEEKELGIIVCDTLKVSNQCIKLNPIRY
jgi:ferritin